ncbi:MAG: aminotransferase class I/II-fold pyridoxal phosphate-dependent enzyme [Corynebacterium provencense]|jgi:N-succinyldiaminopimelate aminotransferase|uniref:aminotransferase class I/II-fold pyridoxal phosphate-dependent enzyme n=1 Tax=Corynebacterium provencense TaxID=1737425 RepID=UPI002989ADC8|nr:aminotransferase class I/II-fold pyridoxal phosphate-dependent enzyme [Corynebacterium provencense]
MVQSPAHTTTSTTPPGRGHRPAGRVAGIGPTIFATVTAEAVRTGAANLGQGFPDDDGPAEMLRIAADAILGGDNQYGPGPGVAQLREAVARDRRNRWGQQVTADDVLVTVGATEAIAASVLGLVDEGQSVVTLEPTYDAYTAAVGLAGATVRPVRLRLSTTGTTGTGSSGVRRWSLDREAFAAAVAGPGTAAVLLNTPHNPTGTVLGRGDLEFIADCVRGTDIVVISDEVYERLAFDGEHIPFATLDGMADRTVTISSAAKSFNVTGWKTGWAIAVPELLGPVTAAKQFLTYVGVTPLQPAVAWALDNADAWSRDWARTLRSRRGRLTTALRDAGMEVLGSDGTYYVITDISPLGLTGADGNPMSAEEFCRRLPAAVGVAGIPVSAFVNDRAAADPSDPVHTLVRWTFCKNDETLDLAAVRLRSGVKVHLAGGE